MIGTGAARVDETKLNATCYMLACVKGTCVFFFFM